MLNSKVLKHAKTKKRNYVTIAILKHLSGNMIKIIGIARVAGLN
jgi:hypothetical protein